MHQNMDQSQRHLAMLGCAGWGPLSFHYFLSKYMWSNELFVLIRLIPVLYAVYPGLLMESEISLHSIVCSVQC